VEGPAVAEAWQVVPGQRELDECRDGAQLMVWAEAPPRAVDVASDIRYAETLGTLGFAEESAELLRDVTARAEAMDDDVSQAEAEFVLAGVLARTGHMDDAVERLEQVYFVAREHGLQELEVRSSLELANWMGSWKGDVGAARVWLKLSRATDERTPLFHANRVRAEAMLLESEGNYEAAIELLEAAMAQHPDADGEARLLLLEVLGTTYDASGRLEQALETTDEALKLAQSLSGDAGSYVPYLLSNEGLIFTRLGRHDEAVVAQQRAVALETDLYGTDYVDSMGPRLNLAVALAGRDDYGEVLEMLPPVLEATERRWGADHPDVALVLEVRGQAKRETGDFDGALVDFERALAIVREALGPDHPDVAKYLDQSGKTLWKAGKIEEARDTYEAAAAAWDRAGQAQSPVARQSRIAIARACARLGAWEDARAHAQKALIAGDSAGPDDAGNLEASFILAQAFVETGTAIEQGMQQAKDAQARASAAGLSGLSSEIATWIGEVETR
jgi:tetratricopeptide (TPR) repeat protein